MSDRLVVPEEVAPHFHEYAKYLAQQNSNKKEDLIMHLSQKTAECYTNANSDPSKFADCMENIIKNQTKSQRALNLSIHWLMSKTVECFKTNFEKGKDYDSCKTWADSQLESFVEKYKKSF